ncbi:hypothetical protein B0J11DRAFT_513133 [Dendryphion nanum]|uniref:Uncharacterized protein n=1 Tax=Dendryphion nanum TaxID=256645 RepID=A0A9P9I5R9_9PLEO|nr:hypothetical protein B0J11DRAFT_513133 [Dendryphion nanum]
MSKRKRSGEGAAIALLTDTLRNLDDRVLYCIELRVQQERRLRRCDTTRDSSTTTTTNNDLSSTDEDTKTLPVGQLGVFLYSLLFSLHTIQPFFQRETKNIIESVLSPADKRIEILRVYKPGRKEARLGPEERFRCFLVDRSLALSFERYLRGTSKIASFTRSLSGLKKEDEQMVADATSRGKAWRMLEKETKVPGISAVGCFQASQFKKGVQHGEMELCAQFLQQPVFEPIMNLARQVSNFLVESQEAFDRYAGSATETNTLHTSPDIGSSHCSDLEQVDPPRTAHVDLIADTAANEPLPNVWANFDFNQEFTFNDVDAVFQPSTND